MRLGAAAIDQHDLRQSQHDDEKDHREQGGGRDQTRAAGLDDLIAALVHNDRRTGRRLEMARPARIVVETLGGLHQRPSAIASINRSRERGCWAGFPLADCGRVSGLPGVAFTVIAGSGAASAVAISWIFGIPEGGVAAPTAAVASTTTSAGTGAAATGAAATGVAAATAVAGVVAGSGAGAAAMTGPGSGSSRSGISSILRCSCLGVTAASDRKRRFRSARRSGWVSAVHSARST